MVDKTANMTHNKLNNTHDMSISQASKTAIEAPEVNSEAQVNEVNSPNNSMLNTLRNSALAAILAVGSAAAITPNTAEASCGGGVSRGFQTENVNESGIFMDMREVEAPEDIQTAVETISKQHGTNIKIQGLASRYRCPDFSGMQSFKVTINGQSAAIKIDTRDEETSTVEKIREALLEYGGIPNKATLKVSSDAKKLLDQMDMTIKVSPGMKPNHEFGVITIDNLMLNGRRMAISAGSDTKAMKVTAVDSGTAVQMRVYNWNGTHQDLTCSTDLTDCVIGEPAQR